MKMGILLLAFSVNIAACTPQEAFENPSVQQPDRPSPNPSPEQPDRPSPEQPEQPQGSFIRVVVGDRSFSATLSDTAAAREFRAMLPLTLTMGDLNANEKYYYLWSNLSTSASRLPQLRNGDLMLFGGSCLVLFYEDFVSSYSYTSIGRVDDPSTLPAALGRGDITVKFEL